MEKPNKDVNKKNAPEDLSRRNFLKGLIGTAAISPLILSCSESIAQVLSPPKEDLDLNDFPSIQLARVKDCWELEENKNHNILFLNPVKINASHDCRIYPRKPTFLFVPVPIKNETQKKINFSTQIIGEEYEVGFDQHGNKFLMIKGEDEIFVDQQFSYESYETTINPALLKNTPPPFEKNDLYYLYTKDEPTIETNSFTELAQGIVGQEQHSVKQCKLIYEAIIHYLNYFKVGGYKGAMFAYKNLGGECGDYSALFCALSRALGIPARPVVGFWADKRLGNTHVWAEFFIEGTGWIPVDPTVGQQSQLKQEYYFGNLDSYRFITSKGVNNKLLNGFDTEMLQTWAIRDSVNNYTQPLIKF